MPSDLPDPAAVEADLHSRDPARVVAALDTLDQAWRRRPAIPMPMPDADALADAFPSGVPPDVVDTFIRVVQYYPAFEPPPDPAGRHTETLEAARLLGPGQAVHDVGAAIRADDHADDAVHDVMRHLLVRPPRDGADTEAVAQLLDLLLDARATHAAVVGGLVHWAFVGGNGELGDTLAQRLDDDDRARIAAARGD